MPTRKDLETGETVSASPPSRERLAIAQAFTYFEDFAYLSLGVLLSACAVLTLVHGGIALWDTLRRGSVLDVVNVLDRLLLVLMIIELLYTVKISFREHALIPEPFLIVGLIAVTRRVLVVTAQLAVLLETPNDVLFRNAMFELALLTVMVLAFVASLLMLRKRSATPVPDRG